jgi:hypothetical protein
MFKPRASSITITIEKPHIKFPVQIFQPKGQVALLFVIANPQGISKINNENYFHR